MQVSIISNYGASYAFVNGREAAGKYWWAALAKAIIKAIFTREKAGAILYSIREHAPLSGTKGYIEKRESCHE